MKNIQMTQTEFDVMKDIIEIEFDQKTAKTKNIINNDASRSEALVSLQKKNYIEFSNISTNVYATIFGVDAFTDQSNQD